MSKTNINPIFVSNDLPLLIKAYILSIKCS